MASAAVRHGSAAIPEVAGIMPPSSRQTLDTAVAEVGEHAGEWAALATVERIALVERLRRGVARVADRWVELSLGAKGISPGEPTAGEEWLSGPYCVLRNLRLLQRALSDIAAVGHPRIPGRVAARSDGQVVARVFPADLWDRLLYRGFRADVWMQNGVTVPDLTATQAVAYAQTGGGAVALVLGAGNISSIPPLDALYKLFVEKKVVLLKMNPVNAYLGPVIAEAFRVLVERGFLHVVYGGVAEGSYLCGHNDVDEIHITGSDRTHDAIVFGAGEEGIRRKAERRPLLTKRITSELGNVTPLIVVPGRWSKTDLEFQGASIATMLAHNAGFDCLTTHVIVTHAGWPQREAFLAAVRRALAAVPRRHAFYPGTEQRRAAFLALHPESERYGEGDGERPPWVLIPGLDSEKTEDVCFTTEAFCGVLAETAVAAPSVPEFVDRAVAFVNENVWGTLVAGLIVLPDSRRDPEVAAAVERAVAELRYGTIAINQWSGTAFGLGTPWGAYAGGDLFDVQSGIGFVHDTLMFSRVQKTVFRTPFRMWPTPPWFVTCRTAHVTGRRLVRFEAAPSLWRFLGVLGAAVRG